MRRQGAVSGRPRLTVAAALPPRKPGPAAAGAAGPPPAQASRGALPALLLSVVMVALAAGLGACSAPRGLVLEPATPAESWVDDGSALELSRAIDHSLEYYRRLAPGTVFRYGDLVYSPEEMAASLELFRDTFLSAGSPEQLERLIAERFHVFASVREEGDNLFTGYYEPELAASETPTGKLDTPLYAMPNDMVKVRLDRFGADLPSMTLVGRVVDGELVPYHSRREIQAQGAVDGQAKPIAYVDEVDLFFLQIQGSGVLRFPDGHRVKVGYAASNGHPYRSIGALLVRNDALSLEEVSLQSIRAWLAANPAQKQKVLFSNPSYVFFHVRDEGPLGNLRVELTPGRSMAVDQRLIPAGSLLYVETEVPVPGSPEETRPVRRFMLAQDTGGAIRGHGRGDLFWGSGHDAEWIAGHQKYGGRLLLLVARKDALPASTADTR